MMKFVKILEKNNVNLKDLYFNSVGYVNGIYESVKEVKKYSLFGNILDLGCGSGFTSYLLINEKFNVFGLDTVGHKEMIKVFENNNKQMNIWKDISNNLLFYDGENIAFKNNFFDAVFLHAVYEHINNKDKILKEIYRVLKNRGYIYIYRTPHKNAWQEKITNAHNDLIDEYNLINDLKNNNFKIIENSKTDFMCWSMPCQNLWNMLFPILHIIDKIMLKTYFKKYAHNLKIIAQKWDIKAIGQE